MTEEPGNEHSLVELRAAANELEAALIVNTLEAYGIRATATGDFTSGFKAEAPGDVRVLVRHKDLQAARNVLREIRESPSDDAS